MDTVKTEIKKDTILLDKGVSASEIKEIHSYQTVTLKEVTDKFDWETVVTTFAWPLTIVFISLFFYTQLKEILSGLAERIKGGDGVEFGFSGIKITKKMDSEAVNSKAEKEFESISEMTKSEHDKEVISIQKSDYIPTYFEIERNLYNSFLLTLYPEGYQVLSNRSIGNVEYDIIIESSKRKGHDYILEVKYFPKKFMKGGLRNTLLAIDSSSRTFEINTKRKVQPILFIILGDQLKIEDPNDVYSIRDQVFDDKNRVKIVMLNESDIKNLNSIRIHDILDYEDKNS